MDALISIRPHLVDRILAGEKRVEVRTRKPNLRPGSRLWIYATCPVASIKAVALIEAVEANEPEMLWQELGSELGISHAEYFAYVRGCPRVYALRLAEVQAVLPAPGLTALRRVVHGFQPPQFFHKLNADHPLLCVLRSQCSVRSGRS